MTRPCAVKWGSSCCATARTRKGCGGSKAPCARTPRMGLPGKPWKIIPAVRPRQAPAQTCRRNNPLPLLPRNRRGGRGEPRLCRALLAEWPACVRLLLFDQAVRENDDRAAQRWLAKMRRIEGADGPHDGYAGAGRAVL